MTSREIESCIVQMCCPHAEVHASASDQNLRPLQARQSEQMQQQSAGLGQGHSSGQQSELTILVCRSVELSSTHKSILSSQTHRSLTILSSLIALQLRGNGSKCNGGQPTESGAADIQAQLDMSANIYILLIEGLVIDPACQCVLVQFLAPHHSM